MRTNRSAAFSLALALCAFSLTLPSNVSAAAATPTEYIRDAVDRAVGTLRDENTGPKLKSERIRALMLEKFDLPRMSQSMVGRTWGEQDPAKQEEFMNLFVALLEKTYARSITIAKDLKVTYVAERLDGDRAKVDTTVPNRGEDLPVSYHLHRSNGGWKIYDLHVMGISLVSNYRSQFNAIISQSSFEELLKRLHQKVEGKD